MTRVTHFEFERSNTCREKFWLLVCFTGMLMSTGRLVYIITSKLKGLGGCSDHHLQGAGAYCGGPTSGRTTCFQVQFPVFVCFYGMAEWTRTGL